MGQGWGNNTPGGGGGGSKRRTTKCCDFAVNRRATTDRSKYYWDIKPRAYPLTQKHRVVRSTHAFIGATDDQKQRRQRDDCRSLPILPVPILTLYPIWFPDELLSSETPNGYFKFILNGRIALSTRVDTNSKNEKYLYSYLLRLIAGVVRARCGGRMANSGERDRDQNFRILSQPIRLIILSAVGPP